MNKLAQLEIKKMMKELDYLVSELDYKNELFCDVDNKFIKTVNDFLDQNCELRRAYDDKIDRRMKEAIRYHESRVDENGNYIPEEQVTSEPEVKRASPKVKKMYREIVKLTHPDKVDDDKLNQMYIEASKFYEEDDLFSMYTMYEQLGISYEVEDNEIGILTEKISMLRQKIELLESTTTWVWYSANDEDFKRDMVLRYILTQIR